MVLEVTLQVHLQLMPKDQALQRRETSVKKDKGYDKKVLRQEFSFLISLGDYSLEANHSELTGGDIHIHSSSKLSEGFRSLVTVDDIQSEIRI